MRRDALIMCVSAGKSVGEIAWRRCKAIGSRGHAVGYMLYIQNKIIKNKSHDCGFYEWF